MGQEFNSPTEIRIDGNSSANAQRPIRSTPSSALSSPSQSISQELTLPHVLANQYYEDRQRFREGTTTVAVLFADLVGSTGYKQVHGVEPGLAKTAKHNQIASDVVVANSGIVVKYLGDGLLAMFEDEAESSRPGQSAASRALKAAESLIEKLHDFNANKALNYPHDITTRVSVHAGPVWLFQYEGTKPLDPQGSTVDLASRIQKLSPPSHVICTASTYDLAQGKKLFPERPTREIRRFVAGFPKPIDVVTFTTVEVSAEDVSLAKLEVVHRAESEELMREINVARSHLKNKNFIEAVKAYKSVLQVDPGNFEANFRLGEFHIQQANGLDTAEKQRYLNLAFDHLCLAKQVRPDVCRVWLLLSLALYKRQSKSLVGENRIQDLKTAIEYAEESLKRAKHAFDADGVVDSKTWLARLLLEQYELSDKSLDKVPNVTRAVGLCAESMSMFDGVFDQHRANLLVTYALVRMANNDTDLPGIDKLIQEAVALDPRNVRAHEARMHYVEYSNRSQGAPLTSALIFD